MKTNRRHRMSRNKAFNDYIEENENLYDENESENSYNEGNKNKIIIIAFLIILFIFVAIFFYNKFMKNNSNKSNENKIAQSFVSDKKRTLKDKHFGFNVEGKIYIDKIKLEDFFVEENVNAIDSSISILSKDGSVGSYGNLTLIGHNKKDFFEDINKLEENDEIIIENIYGEKTKYKVKSKREINPNDLSGLVSNNTKKELTLITCINDETKRLEIKAEAK